MSVEKGKRRIRICLLCLVLAAVVVGLFYYYYQMQSEQEGMQGTLITNIGAGMKQLWPR